MPFTSVLQRPPVDIYSMSVRHIHCDYFSCSGALAPVLRVGEFFTVRRIIWMYKSKSAFSTDKEEDKQVQSNSASGRSCGLEAFKSSPPSSISHEQMNELFSHSKLIGADKLQITCEGAVPYFTRTFTLFLSHWNLSTQDKTTIQAFCVSFLSPTLTVQFEQKPRFCRYSTCIAIISWKLLADLQACGYCFV